MSEQRTLETSIEVRATPAAVWKALTDAEELTRWFPMEARVTPGVGGSIWTSWKDEYEDTARIEVWEPNRRLVLASGIGAAGLPARLTVDYTIEAKHGAAGVTVLRLVHSGFGRGGDWDWEFDATKRGWSFELRGLRHYLERHAGKPRRVAWIRRKTDKTPEQAWTRIMGGTPGSHGLLSLKPLPTLREGDPYRFITADGETISGEARVFGPPRDFAGTVRELNDAYLRLRIDHPCSSGGVDRGIEINLWLSMYGATELEAEVVEHRWGMLMGRA
ncbi:MAG: SRPBCC family protein [Phycisphaerales bacterium]